MRKILTTFAALHALLVAVLFTTAAQAATAPLRTDHLTSRLVAAATAVTPGQALDVGLLLEHDPHWHTYWQNAGDSGSATQMAFTLPDGFSASDIRWPVPERIPVLGLVNYGYSDRALLPVRITVPAPLPAGEVTLVLKADWLICEEECIPGEGEYRLTLPVAAAGTSVGASGATDPRWAADFARAEARQPRTDAAVRAGYRVDGDTLTLDFSGAALPADLSAWTLFPEAAQFITNAATPVWQRTDTGWQARLPVSEYFAGAQPVFPVLLARGDEGLRVEAALVPAAATGQAGESAAGTTLWLALILALAGGLVLNLMPCVFPVLSFKAMGALEHADDRRALRRHGLFYTAGVVLSFLALAGVLLALRQAGSQIGWGFQLQEPRFVAGLAILMFVMAMSFAGLLELGARLAGLGQSLTEAQGDRGAFFTGVLACVVASPCTAPFMGTALGFALAQPAVVALAVFAALGLGLALPMLLLGFVPALARLLPRPGAWMEGFRQFLAFPLLLTVIWLVWVYGEQTSALDMAWLLAALTLIAFGLWLRARPAARAPAWQRLRQGIALLAIVAGAVVPLTWVPPVAVAAAAQQDDAWSEARLAELRAAGKPVLVNMTAAWCITCLANERSTLSADSVRQALADKGVTYLKGDWTRRDPAISRYLESFGRNGVPLYVLYPAGGEPEVLPQILTPALVQAALDKL